MSLSLNLDKSSRLLIVVPHPDDEILATGVLIQKALSEGSSLRIVIATDGDDNPWPQRWIEKRWRIDAERRKHWGQRRRDEATEALSRLGIQVEQVRYYGWPDQGLTDRLMGDSRCEDQLVAEIDDFSPTHVVAPSLSDLHPDHSALRVLLEIALKRSSFERSQRLGFVVHGTSPHGESVVFPASDECLRKKQFALKAHASQLLLSGARMRKMCSRLERFESSMAAAASIVTANHREWQMAPSTPVFSLRERALYLVVTSAKRVTRASLPLPHRGGCFNQEIERVSEGSLNAQLVNASGRLSVTLTSDFAIDQVFAKIERLGSRLFIYDRHGWKKID